MFKIRPHLPCRSGDTSIFFQKKKIIIKIIICGEKNIIMKKFLQFFKYIIYNLDILILEEISIEKLPIKKKFKK